MRPAIPSEHQLSALRAYWRRHKAFPSMAKLADVMGLASSGGVFKALGRLVDAGYLERVEGRVAPTRKFFALPMLGTVRAGVPQPAPQDAEFEAFSVDEYLMDHPERTSLCRVRGDSMKDAGLLDGDLVLVEARAPAKAGDVVVAVVDGQTTVKYLRTDSAGAWLLQPANPAYETIRPNGSLEVLGVVIGSMRRYRR